jgi:hypothetical protein
MRYKLESNHLIELQEINDRHPLHKVVACDYGQGACIEDDFLTMDGFADHVEWFNENVDSFIPVEDDVELEI